MSCLFDVDRVLSQLSEKEKVSLLSGIDFWHTRPLPAHEVPSIRLSDGPNGVRGTRFFNSVPSACFPCGTALAATFDQTLAADAGRLMAKEAHAKGVHVLLGPTINMQRSPLGGRGFESFSEDPVLSGLVAAAVIKGIQAEPYTVAATLKHFVCNDQEHERNKVNSIVTDRALREIYLLPFQIAIRDAKPRAIMTAYNKINGLHVSEDPKFLERILRREWGWKGLIMSDWFGTYSTAEAINAGLDLEMPGPARWRGEVAALANATNKLSPTALDDRAREVLQLVKDSAKSKIPENAPETTENNTTETAALLRRLASESIVLLKNDRSILPLSKDKKTLVIGPNAEVARFCAGGSAALRPYYAVSPLEGIVSKIGKENVSYTLGTYAHKELPDLGMTLSPTPDCSAKGIRFLAYNQPPGTTGRHCVDDLVFETSSMMFMDYKNSRIKDKLWYADIEGFYEADRDGLFEVGVCVYGSAKVFVNCELIIDLTEHQEQGSAFLGCGTAETKGFVHMKRGQTYHIRLEFASAPTSKLKSAGVAFGGGAVRIGGAWQIDKDAEILNAAELARSAEQVVLCIGLNMDWEGEGFDREHMELPLFTDRLTEAVLEANPSTVIVLQSGTPVAMPWIDEASTILQAWYGGNETGNGIADVLFGDVNPSGKLPLSWPKRDRDTPTYGNFRSEAGRVLYGEDVYMGYRWYDLRDLAVQFPFGHGLSYTTFMFQDLEIHKDDETLKISLTVANTGGVPGAEVVQIYVSQNNPSIKRPVKELKGVAKVFLEKGETQAVTISIPLRYACGFYDEWISSWMCEKDTFKIWVAPSSDNASEKALSAQFALDHAFTWRGV